MEDLAQYLAGGGIGAGGLGLGLWFLARAAPHLVRAVAAWVESRARQEAHERKVYEDARRDLEGLRAELARVERAGEAALQRERERCDRELAARDATIETQGRQLGGLRRELDEVRQSIAASR